MQQSHRTRAALAISLLTLFALGVHGYHPYAEDGGLYLAGIRKLLDPALYPYFTEFVTEHLRFSLFAPVVATIVRLISLPLMWTIVMLYLASVWLTLGAAWMLTARVVKSFAGQLGAVSLLACWLVLPVAGTSLMLTDPYLTARSWSTPLTLAALAWTFDLCLEASSSKRRRAAWGVCGALAAAALIHPLMATYGLAAVFVLLSSGGRITGARRWIPWLLAGLALLAATIIQRAARPESADYIRIAMTRYYWFPLRWEWYEQLGLFAPLAVLAWLGRSGMIAARIILARAALVLALISLAVAAIFCRAGLATHLVARLQPLRAYQIVYLIMILLLGAWLAETVLKTHLWRWGMLFACIGGLMFFVARSTYPASAQVEMPFGADAMNPRNPWERAFLWSALNTPVDALFALDAHYITRDGEDAQTFRALAQRSALADYSKDGGEASITPSLTAAWVVGQNAQTGLDTENDPARIAHLAPLGVTWLVLKRSSPTLFVCPYQNEAAKVCKLPSAGHPY